MKINMKMLMAANVHALKGYTGSYDLTGVYIRPVNQGLVFEASDKYTLFAILQTEDCGEKIGETICVPCDILKNIETDNKNCYGFLTQNDKKITIAYKDNSWVFRENFDRPRFENIIPKLVGGGIAYTDKAGDYNPELIMRFQNSLEILGYKNTVPRIYQNENDRAMVLFREVPNCFGVVAPLRRHVAESLDNLDWYWG